MRDDELKHYGVKGMKWGVRRYQNSSGRKYGLIDSFNRGRLSRSNEKLQKDIDSFKPVRNGTKTKSGKQVLSRQDVSGLVRELKNRQNINNAKIKRIDDKYSGRQPEKTIKNARLKKALKTTGRVAADVATLGVSRKIRKRENEIKKHGNDIMFRYEVGANAIGRAMKFQTRRKILDGVKMVAALAGAGAYVASKNNPKVKKGAMAAGKILNTLSNVSLATLAAYDVYDTYRDIRDVYSKKKGKE